MQKVHSKNMKICTIRKFPAIWYSCGVIAGSTESSQAVQVQSKTSNQSEPPTIYLFVSLRIVLRIIGTYVRIIGGGGGGEGGDYEN